MGCKHSWFWLCRWRSTGCLVDWLECERKRIQGWCHAIHGILGSRSDTEVGFPGTRSTIETLVTRTQFLATRHQYSCEQTRCQVKLYKSLLLGTIGRSLADQFSEDQICSGQGFRSYLEAEPEVQAEIALYQSTRSPKGRFVEYTSRISNKLREMESGFKQLLPPKLKGFIIKRQAKLTHDQAKHLQFYIPTRGLEADKMVDALNRLDQTDALVEQILGDRAKLEHHVYRGHAHPHSHAQAYPMEAQTTASSESNHYHNHKTSSDTESDQVDWDLMVIPWWTKMGPLWYPYHWKDLWMRMKRVR